MVYKYSFDNTTVGSWEWEVDSYVLIQECLQLLLDEINIWNKRVFETGAGRMPYAKVAKDIQRMINWGEKKIASSDGVDFEEQGVTVGSLRYIKASLLLAIRKKKEELEKKIEDGWPSGASSALGAKIDDLEKLADTLNYEPADILLELIPKQQEGEEKGGESNHTGKNDITAIVEDARSAFTNSEFDKAIEICDKALSINPNHIKAMSIRALSYSRLGKYDEAIKQFDVILKTEPNNVGALEGKGLALLNKNDYAATYYTFEFLAKLDPSNIIAWHSMGEALFYRNSFDEAIVCLDKAITINPHSDRSWVMKAKALLKKGKHEEAFNCFDEALKHAVNKSYVLLEKGIAYRKLGDKSEEFYCYDRAIENNPKYIQAYMQKAHSLSQVEDYVGAIECFKKGIDNDLEPEQEAILWHNFAVTYLQIRNYEEAYRSINRSLELHANDHTRRIKNVIENAMSSKERAESENYEINTAKLLWGFKNISVQGEDKVEENRRYLLSPYAEKINAYSTFNTSHLNELENGKEVVIGGMITKIRFFLTKTGRNAGSKMAYFTLEDLQGEVDVVMFPDVLNKFNDMLIADTIVFVKGKIDHRREKSNILAVELISLDEAKDKLEYADKQLTLYDFKAKLDIVEKKIFDRVINLSKSSNTGLYTDISDENYINLRLKRAGKSDNVAIQIHRYGEGGRTIALAVAGAKKGAEREDPELNDFIVKGNITELSGYKKGVGWERGWLNGNLPSTGSREKAEVYVLKRDILVNTEAWNKVEELIEWAVENFDKLPSEEPDKAKTIGPVPTIINAQEGEPDSAQKSVSIGSGCHIRREASPDEQCLNVHSYANVLSTFFKKATDDGGEFCFGLFGHWGRGKTYLMDMVKDELKDDKDCPYETIFFSAWKYRTTPEAWIHLYERFAEHLQDTRNWFSILPSLIRSELVQRGIMPLIIGIFIFGTSLISLSSIVTDLLLPFLSVLGIAGFLFCFYIFMGSRRIIPVMKRYFTLKRHGGKLGLQALIGKDLKTLIIGWVPKEFFKNRFPICRYVFYLNILFVSFILFPIKPQSWPLWLALSNKTPNWLSWPVFIAWMAISIIGILYTILGERSTKQLLLVIDDLDRCRPEQMLEIIESLKLLLEDREIHERIQVVMLVDEKMLHHAIQKKFTDFIKSYNTEAAEDSNKDVLNRVTNEHIEKLFACYLRLPELSVDEVSEVTRKYLELYGSIEDTVRISSTLAPTESADNDDPGNDTKESLVVDAQEITTTQDEESAKKEPIASEETREVSIEDAVFSSYERGRLALAIPSISQLDKSRKWGPRSIRVLLFKYQLSRLLLMALRIKFTPKELIDKLSAGVVLGEAQPRVSKDVKRVIDQVI